MALIIGNSAYEAVPLVNPEYDAMGIGAVLWTAGFEVRIGVDLTKAEMEDAIQGLNAAASKSEIAFLHFSGHGIQLDRENYLLPIDFSLTDERNVPATAIAARDMINALKGAKLAVVVLDACRNNPFPRRIGPVASRMPVASGLAPIDSSYRENFIIAFSTGPGEIALDGEGAHSPFSGAVIDNIARDEEVSLVFQRVRDVVNKQTDREQLPWGSSNLIGTNILAGKLPEGEQARRSAIVERWKQALIANSPESMQTFIAGSTDNPFLPIARKKLLRLRSAAMLPAESRRIIALARQLRFQPK